MGGRKRIRLGGVTQEVSSKIMSSFLALVMIFTGVLFFYILMFVLYTGVYLIIH